MPRAEPQRHTVIGLSVCLLQAFLVAHIKISAETSNTTRYQYLLRFVLKFKRLISLWVMEWFAHIDGCCWRSGIIWRLNCPQLTALQLVYEFICTAWQAQKKLVKITLTCNCAVMLLIMWLSHDFWLHIILCKQQLFNSYLSVTCTAGKQGLKCALTILLHCGNGGTLFFLLSFTDILDHKSTSFYRRTPLIQVQVHSWVDQESDHTNNSQKHVSNNEEHGLLGIPTTEWDGLNTQWKYTCTWFFSTKVQPKQFW